MAEDTKLTLLGHLKELRSRIFRIVIGLCVSLIISYFITDRFFYILIDIAPKNTQLIYTEITEMMGTYIKVMLLLACVITLPFIVHQIVMFIKPALTKRERNYLYLLLPSIFVFFTGGAVFAYFILLPPAVNFLLTFQTDIAVPMIKIGNYVSVITKLIFWVGICFEIPLVMFFFTKIGILKPEMLSKFRKGAYIMAFVLGAIITPTFDPINQSLVAIPIIFLYEFGILLSKIARGKRAYTKGSV